MQPLKTLYTKAVLQPLANYLIERNSKKLETTKDASGPGGFMLRDQRLYGNNYIQTGTGKSKPGSAVDFKTLRMFAVQYDVARACVNRRKRELNGLEWAIVSEDPSKKVDENLAADLQQQFKHLGGYRVRFREMMDLMVEDLLVLDALSIYKRPTVGGELHSLQVVDAATIKLRVDDIGGTPEPPEVAYKQVIRGEVIAEFTADEMYYEMMNPRTETPYGLSPLESMILGVSTALKSELYNMNMLTEGNIPEGLYSVDANWSSDQIKQYQAIWDAALAGNAKALSRIRFVPPGEYKPTVKPEDMRYHELQTWLMKKCCMLFEIPPQSLGFTETVNKSTGDVQHTIGQEAGLEPLAHFFEEIFTDVVQIDLGHPELRFKFLGLGGNDEKIAAETNQILIQSGQRTPNEARKKDGLDPIKDPLADMLMVTSGTPTFLNSELQASAAQAKADAATAAASAAATPDANAGGNDNGQADDAGTKPADTTQDGTNKVADRHVTLVSELRTFRKYALARIKDGKQLRNFSSTVLPANVVGEINTRLQKAQDMDEARGIFREYMADYQVDFLSAVADLKRDLSKVR